jgi:hypothetical protein
MKIIPLMLLIMIIFSSKVAFSAQLNDLDVLDLPECHVELSSCGEKLLLSNSPEMVPEEGILYQDAVEGNVRLFFHHVNTSDSAKKFTLMLQNEGNEDVRVEVLFHGIGGPGYNWLSASKQAEMEYFSNSRSYYVNVPAGFSIPLVEEMDREAVLPNMLITGILDLQIEHKIVVKFVMLPVNADNWTFSRQAKILPPDEEHLRGTFEGANRKLSFSQEYDPNCDGPMTLTLADNKIDPFLEGIDATDGSKVVNRGNYGVVYQIYPIIKRDSKVAYYINPRGGIFAGAIGVKCYNTSEKLVETPSGKTYFGEDKRRDFAALGTYGQDELAYFIFSPPGASNLPVKIVMFPM